MTGIPLGSAVSINCTCTAEHDYNRTSSNTSPPIQILWIRNGITVVEDSDHSIDVTNLTNFKFNSNLQIANFAHDDTGVYQCIFKAEIELVTTRPFRLQTGEYWYKVKACMACMHFYRTLKHRASLSDIKCPWLLYLA